MGNSAKSPVTPTAPDVRLIHERMLQVARFATMGEVTAGIAHEINQPLTSIVNYARACEHFLAPDELDLEEARLAVREIGAEALRAGDIIRRVRKLIGNQSAERALCDINALIEELRVLAIADAHLHDAQVRFELDPALPRASLDAIQIQLLLLNLLRNAFEALAQTPVGAREVVIRTGPAVDGDIEISVSDNGTGVHPGIADTLFDPFSSTKENGTGLGLAISRAIARAHGGSIGYRPQQPAGTCFWLRVPAVEVDRP